MILLLAGLVQGYFLMNYFLIANIDKSIQSSLQYYQIIAQRDPLLSELISFYRESLARNETIYMMPSQID